MRRGIADLDWDDGNSEKCQKHGVSLAEIEQVFRGAPAVLIDKAHSTAAERRHLAIGKTTHGRYVFVAFTLRHREGKVFVRPISARYMHRKEVEYYEKEKAPGA